MTTQDGIATPLVLTLGLKWFNWASCTFDKATGTARFEQTKFFWPCKPVVVPLADISDVRVGTTINREDGVNDKRQYPEILFKSRKPLALCDGSVTPMTARDTVAKIRAFLGLPVAA